MNNGQYDRISSVLNGTTQAQRLPHALKPEGVLLDDRSLSDLLAFSAEYARLVRHFTLKNDVSGTWEGFFDTDISVILAQIVSTNLSEIEQIHQQQVRQMQQSYQEADKYAHLLAVYQHIHSIADQINTWFLKITRINLKRRTIEDEVAQEMHHMLDRTLGTHLRTLIAYDKAAEKGIGGAIGLQYDQFDGAWGVDPAEVEPDPIFKGKTAVDRMDAALLKLRILYRAFYNVLSYKVFNFQSWFERSLTEKANHKPEIGLFISFLKLFRHAQHDLNGVAGRHLDFYYRHFLLQKRREAVPDELHLALQPADYVRTFVLPEGTQILAGRDEEGNPVHFSTTEPVPINQAHIESLRTIYLGKYAKRETTTFQLITGIYDAPIAKSQDGIGAPFTDRFGEWPTFGEEQEEKGESYRTMRKSEVGFAIASPVLFLAEGEREVKVTLSFKEESAFIYRRLIVDIKEQEGYDNLEDAFFRAFPPGELKNLSVYLTGSEGWLRIEPQALAIEAPEPWEPYSLTLAFTLPVSAPAIVGYRSREFDGTRFVTRYPLMKVILNNEVEPYCYSFLKEVELDQVDIQVNVKGIRQLQVYNDIGQVDPRQPFQPFGPLPARGSYMLIGNKEMFRKGVDDFHIDMEWQNIPETTDEFAAFYRAYGLDMVPEKFRVRLSALTENAFHPAVGEELEYPLFQPLDNADDLDEIREIRRTRIRDINVERLELTPDPKLEELEAFDSQTRTGYFKLELSEPSDAFGHHVYQRLFAEVVTENAKPGQDPVDQREIPNQPYTPLLKSLSLSYKASTSIRLAHVDSRRVEQLFHIHPFGQLPLYNKGELRLPKAHLLPQYEADGFLYIGLRDLEAPQDLSLWFQLTTSHNKGHTIFRVPEIRWSYLANNEWIKIKDEHHLSDTTDQFTRAGIVKLHIPRGATNRNNVMPSGLYWLRVSVAGDTEVLSHAMDVRAQGVHAVWVKDGPTSRLQEPLLPDTASALVQRIPEITGIAQPFPSFNGRPEEVEDEFLARISERLRHKHRAVTHWDFERMVLGNFHTVHQVKALSYMRYPDYFERQDGITLVVVPRQNDSQDPKRPLVNYNTLYKIDSLLSQNISPFIKMEVRNPEYEYIRVYGDIRFQDGYNNGQTLERLNQDLLNFVCPWIENPVEQMELGGSLSIGVIQNFIKGLPYVQFLTGFSVLHIVRNPADGRYHIIRDTSQRYKDDLGNKVEVGVLQAKPWSSLIPDDELGLRIIDEEKEREATPIALPIRFQGKDIYDDKEQIIIRRRIKRQEDDMDGSDNYTLTINL